jgi:hypothetical protein
MRRQDAAQKSHVPFCVATCVEAIITELTNFCTNKLLLRPAAQRLSEGALYQYRNRLGGDSEVFLVTLLKPVTATAEATDPIVTTFA